MSRDHGDRPGPHTPDDVSALLAALDTPPMPVDVTARISAVLAEELRGGRRGGERAAHRPTRTAAGRVRPAVLAGLVAAAVVAVAAVTVTAGAPPAPRVTSEQSDLQAAGAGAVGEQSAGPLTDPTRRRACLAGVGVPAATAPLLGGRPYAVRGEPGTLLVLGTEVRGRFRLVVVDPACGAGGGRLLASTTAGR